jgi:hypothetical protein
MMVLSIVAVAVVVVAMVDVVAALVVAAVVDMVVDVVVVVVVVVVVTAVAVRRHYELALQLRRELQHLRQSQAAFWMDNKSLPKRWCLLHLLHSRQLL